MLLRIFFYVNKSRSVKSETGITWHENVCVRWREYFKELNGDEVTKDMSTVLAGEESEAQE